MVKDLGFSNNAYEKAKEKLTRKFGGKRRLVLTHMATLRGLPKVRRHNLEDMEALLAVLDRIQVVIQDDEDGEREKSTFGPCYQRKVSGRLRPRVQVLAIGT